MILSSELDGPTSRYGVRGWMARCPPLPTSGISSEIVRKILVYSDGPSSRGGSAEFYGKAQEGCAVVV